MHDKTTSTTAIQHLFLEPADRWAANQCSTSYPTPWVPTMIKARTGAFPIHSRSGASFAPQLARILFLLVAVLIGTGSAGAGPQDTTAPGNDATSEGSNHPLPPYRARFERLRPVIAIIGENAGTELTDFTIPYGVLVRSGAAEVVTVATQPGEIRMSPSALRVKPDFSIAEFDSRYPQGADYVIVPAVMKFRDPTLLAWVKTQGDKGGTLMSICDGAAVVAGTGLMNGRSATAHWASEKNRRRLFPEVKWVDNTRYVADGSIISTAGISAALPASLALVEAIAGRDRATNLAHELGVHDWSAAHETAPFRPKFGVNLRALIGVTYTNGWFHSTEMIGLPIDNGIDEIALAITADGYSRTGRSMLHALSMSTDPVRTRSGLIIVPDTRNDRHRMNRELPALKAIPSAGAFSETIDGIYLLYGRNTAYGVALNFEYPLVPKCPLKKSAEAQ